MARRKRPELSTASNELEEALDGLEQAEAPVSSEVFDASSIDPLMYETKATPKLKVVVTATSKDELDEAKVLKHLLRRDRIRCSIYNLSGTSEDGTITAKEELLADSIKNCCVVVCMTKKSFKFIALRAWLAGRQSVSWGPLESGELYNTGYNVCLDRTHKLPELVRKIKSSYSKDIIQEIRRSAFKFMEVT